jgi:hypothetical protein
MSTPTPPERRRGCLTALLVIIGVVVGMFLLTSHLHTTNFAPNDLEVTGILYDKQERWGIPFFGLPGDNETGLVVYGLKDAIADRISAEGIGFFYRAENRERRTGRQVAYAEWHETPIIVDRRWTFRGSPPPRIAEYLDRYGFSIAIDKSIETMIDDAIRQPGSYYAYGPAGGLVIVIPKARRAVFAYAG